MTKTLLLTLATVVLFSLNFIRTDINATAYATPPYDHKEKFDPALSNLQTVDQLDAYITKQTTEKGLQPGTVEYVEAIKNVLSERFYHGFSHLSVNQNWIASFSEKIFGYGLSCNVNADEIMKHPYAACSQQCIIMMEMLKRRKIDYRSVGFPHHYTVETKLNNQWYYFDPNMEPNIPNSERIESKWKCCADNLKKYYDSSRFKDLDFKFGNNTIVILGKVNESPGPNAKRFQSASGVLSKIAFCFPLMILLYRRKYAIAKRLAFKDQKNFIEAVWLILSRKPNYKFS